MDGTSIAWPQKTRELHSHHFDSTIWNDFAFRDDDIVIATYAKSGTTWTQQIVGQLLFGGAHDVPVAQISPWLDLRVPPKAVKLPVVEAQTHRRFLKTHLPVDALVFSPKAKYIYIGRDGRDVVWRCTITTPMPTIPGTACSTTRPASPARRSDGHRVDPAVFPRMARTRRTSLLELGTTCGAGGASATCRM
jgi:hypothetical protein